jgi:CHASE3 domain sensor protein
MARETVAQRNARFDAEREARLAKEVAEYPQRLMTALGRATDAYFKMAVSDNKFLVQTLDEYSRTYTMAYAHSPNSQEQLEDLEWEVEQHEKRMAEAKRVLEVKADALRKVNEVLSAEQRELLGL